MIAKTQNFNKLRCVLDVNKYSDEYIELLLSRAYSECLAYTKRESLPNEDSNNDILSMAFAILNDTSKAPVYNALAKYIIQSLGGYSCIVVNNLPSYQEKDVVYAIIGESTTNFYRNGILIDTKNNEEDNDPYFAGEGIEIDNHVISSSGGLGGGNVRRFQYEDVEIEEEDWTQENDLYVAEIDMIGVIEDMTVNVYLSLVQSQSTKLLSVCESYDGGIKFYATEPENIVIPLVNCDLIVDSDESLSDDEFEGGF